MKKADEIGEYLKNKGKIQDIGDFKHELEQIEKGIKTLKIRSRNGLIF